jgi:hypothetical protein
MTGPASPAPQQDFPARLAPLSRGEEENAGKPRDLQPQSGGMTAAIQPPMAFERSMPAEFPGQPPAEAMHWAPAQRAAFAPEAATFRNERSVEVDLAALGLANPSFQASAAHGAQGEHAPAGLQHLAARLVEEVLPHVELIRAGARDRLEVVLRPDGFTVLHLEVSRVDGLIQVRASCEHGHLPQIEAQWGALQNALAAQGIRVEPLQSAPNGGAQAGGFTGGQQQQQGGQFQKPEPAWPHGFEQDTPHPSTNRPGQPDGSTRRGWQRWA